MAIPAVRIRHGELEDVTGRPHRFEDVTFIPARVTLFGSSFSFHAHLYEFTHLIPAGMESLVHPGNDAPWVLGRLMSLFAISPSSPEMRPEKSCFHESFVIVMHSSDNLAIPFHCTDYYCKSALIFSDEDPPDPTVQEMIANRFWSFLFSDAASIVDYESRMFHSGACVWIRFGIEGGEPFIRRDEDDDV